MQEITLEELYEVLIWTDLGIYLPNGSLNKTATKNETNNLLTDLNKLGYKIVKQ